MKKHSQNYYTKQVLLDTGFLKSLGRPLVVLGATGHVGRALMNLLGPNAIGLNHFDVPLDQIEKVLNVLERTQPAIVINAAAYTQVDRAEEEEALAFQVNGLAPEAIAIWCMEHHIPFIHYSTDYVFSGEGSRPWSESDPTKPLNAYGRTKLFGEQAITRVGGEWLIFRTSWVYDKQGKNFLNTMLRIGLEKETLHIVSDQIGAPTYAPALAQATIEVLKQALKMPKFPSGIYNLCGTGETSWYSFAQAIFANARDHDLNPKVKIVEPIRSSKYPTPAERPLNSRLSMEKIQSTFNISMPHWSASLTECFSQLDQPQESRHVLGETL